MIVDSSVSFAAFFSLKPMRVFPSPVLDHSSFFLRPIEQSDTEAWYAYLSLPHVIEHTSWRLTSSDDLRHLIDTYNSNIQDSPIQFAIVEKATQVFVGSIGFHTISEANRTAEIAYNLHPNYWGQNIATSCCRSLARWGLVEGGYVRIQATVLDTNLASRRVIEKCGFEQEGKLRHFRMVRGMPRDFWIYSITNDDINNMPFRS